MYARQMSALGFCKGQLWACYKVAAIARKARGPTSVKARFSISSILVSFIRYYQVHLAKLNRAACLYEPSCSEYAIQSIEALGFLKGSHFAVRRILRCRPPHSGGYDPFKLVSPDEERQAGL
jgi:putative membrane protein insertion efficiency factor